MNRLCGYVIKDEMIVNPDNTDKTIIPIKMEGEMAAKGEKIFRYKAANEADLNNKIEELNAEVQKAIAGKPNLFSRDIGALDNQINSKIEGLNKENSIQNILEYKKDINYYIAKKAQIAGNLSPADSYINGLISQKTEYENEITSGAEVTSAPSSGVVSYRIDNLETKLKLDNLDSLRYKSIRCTESENRTNSCNKRQNLQGGK